MKVSEYILDVEEKETSVDFKQILYRYSKHWVWFLICVLTCLFVGYVYSRYAKINYATKAKIKIIDESKQLDLNLDPTALFDGASKLNMDNEIEILKSYRIVNQVVGELNLNTRIFLVGKFKKREIWETPFTITHTFLDEDLKNKKLFFATVEGDKVRLTDENGNRVLNSVRQKALKEDQIKVVLDKSYRPGDFESDKFEIVVKSNKETVIDLIKELNIKTTNNQSEIISLSLEGENPKKNEAIINTLIDKFNQDGILDRQLVSRRTLNFIDERFIFLSNELDSIEVNKKSFKQNNNLSYIEADADITIKEKSSAEEDVFRIETQISLSRLLLQTLTKEKGYSLLPSDIGLENSNINVLVSGYNERILEREKLLESAGANNPMLQSLSSQLQRAKKNIIQTIKVYQRQLRLSLQQFNVQRSITGSKFMSLPEKEKILRSIERQQKIKENLYILLLTKREEAAIELAVTSPSIKVVDYSLTATKPISPNKKKIYGLSFFTGLLLPFLALFLIFYLDNKIRNKKQLSEINPSIPVLAEIPKFDEEKIFSFDKNRSLVEESFRILNTNMNYLLPKKTDGKAKIIYVTSTVKEEGKTLISTNLSLAIADINKKVLLVGADLRNPQLHNYFNIDKNRKGLSDILYQPNFNWRECLFINDKNIKNHKICFSGVIPPNASTLLASDNFEKFLEEAGAEFDYIIVDTPPTLVVADTLIISKFADVTLFVVRAGKTLKGLINFSTELFKAKKLKNLAYVLNDIKIENLGYGNSYNYGGAPENNTLLERIFTFVKEKIGYKK